MGAREELSNEELQVLAAGPFAAAIYVASASGGVLDLVKELYSVVKLIDEATKRGASGFGPLADIVLAELRERKGSGFPEMNIYEDNDNRQSRENAKQMVVEAGWLADQHMGGEGYKRWLEEMGKKAAEASRRSWLDRDSSASPIDEVEQIALNELRQFLRA